MSESQLGLLREFFKNNPNRDIEHPEVVDWATSEWEKRTGDKFRDPDRGIRSLHQKGFLQKVHKGIYRYDPNMVKVRKLEDFKEAVKKQILERDDYKCVVCGRGKKDGVELQVDHIKPKDKGGKATIDNGQTLCGKHNYIKKNYDQTTFGKRIFVNMYKSAEKLDDQLLMTFCNDILEVYEKHGIDDQIKLAK